MAEHVVAIDQGTTGTSVMVFDSLGRLRSRAYAEVRQYHPRPGWVEHDADEIWTVTRKVTAAALRSARVRPKDIAAIGIANQRATAVLWDRVTGRPVQRAIVWQDRRTVPDCERLKAEGAEATIRAKTGLVVDPAFAATKVQWLLDHGPRLRARVHRLAFGTIDTWLIWKLTGGEAHAMDFTNASRTLLFDIHRREWDHDLLRVFEVPEEVLPRLVPSAGVVGMTAGAAFGAEVPIAGIAADQQAALFAHGGFVPGAVKNTYGSACVLLMFTGEVAIDSKRGLLTTIACGADGGPAYALEGTIVVGGAAVQWLRDELRLLKRAADSEHLARTVDSTRGVYVVPAFTGLGAPYRDPAARGAIVGLTRGVRAAHLVRATLESLAYQTRDVVDTMVAESGRALTGIAADGGAAANDFLMQFQADVLGSTVDRPKLMETTAVGAALLAGLGVGLWRSARDVARLRRAGRRFRPHLPPERREALYQGWRRAVAAVRALGA